MENPDELNQMASFLQYIEEQLKQFDMQHNAIEQGINDLMSTMMTIENMENEPAGSDGNLQVVLPIGDGGFIRTAMKKPASYLVSIGARYLLESNQEASTKILESQKEKMVGTLGIIEQRMKQLAEQAEKVRPELEQRMQAERSGLPGKAPGPMKTNKGRL
jgi:prefoldin alpha subunit